LLSTLQHLQPTDKTISPYHLVRPFLYRSYIVYISFLYKNIRTICKRYKNDIRRALPGPFRDRCKVTKASRRDVTHEVHLTPYKRKCIAVVGKKQRNAFQRDAALMFWPKADSIRQIYFYSDIYKSIKATMICHHGSP